MTDLRFPVGKFTRPEEVTPAQREEWIDQIAAVPEQLQAALAGLDEARLDTPYREGGWSIRQVVHHLPDSHLNAFVRFKLALTEDTPLIKPYDEAAWANLADARDTPVQVSAALLTALHQRWVVLLRSLDEAQWQRSFRHPEMGEVRLDQTLGLYAWHGRHHLAHITGVRERGGW
jgi:uncharacterized damage-inducible protein DinB